MSVTPTGKFKSLRSLEAKHTKDKLDAITAKIDATTLLTTAKTPCSLLINWRVEVRLLAQRFPHQLIQH